MYYFYVLQLSNDKLYFGFTGNIRNRIKEHKGGFVYSTKKYLPARLVYYECYLSFEDAKKREKMIKKFGSTYSHLKGRISNSLKVSSRAGASKLND